MNIYNFIYCYFYNLWKSKGGGRLDASAHVLFVIIIHSLLISEITQDLTGVIMIKLPDYGGAGANKYMYFLFAVPFWVSLLIFYSTARTKRLLREYHLKYGEAAGTNTLKILLVVILPIILLITLAVIRQRS
jgi:hypothetical protein